MDVRELLIDGYSMNQINQVIDGSITLSDLQRSKPEDKVTHPLSGSTDSDKKGKKMSIRKNNDTFAGDVRPDGEVIKVSAAVGDATGQMVQRNESGIYLLEHGQEFSLILSNYIARRQVLMHITGDDESTVIADGLVLQPNRIKYALKRWLSVDQAFVAYRRESEEGDAVGGQSVSDGGGGLIKIVFTIGRMEAMTRSTPAVRGPVRSVTRGLDESSGEIESFSVSMSESSSSEVEEGVMGAGKETGQRFRKVTFNADTDLPEFEIQLRWGIVSSSATTPPPDRRVVSAPGI
ncbi:MAG: hypothetical protein AAF702_48055 [Chloroflexota bacterium]